MQKWHTLTRKYVALVEKAKRQTSDIQTALPAKQSVVLLVTPDAGSPETQ